MNTGADRIEFSPVLGRPIRQGTFAELSVSDRLRVLQAIEARDLERLTSYWGYLTAGQQLMIALGYEWALRWILECGPEVTARGHRVFLDSLDDSPIGRMVGELLENPEELSGLANPQTSRLGPHLPQPTSVLERAQAGDWDSARILFESEFLRAKAWHDFLFRHSYAVMSALLEEVGEQPAQEAVERVLKSTSFYEPGWQQAAMVEPEQLAVMLSEHLRLHFSGPDGGAVEIIEEADRIRLVFAPCGSGGTMRRQIGHLPGFAKLQQPSQETWGRSGEVPLYCSHCAVNELESQRRFGHKKWFTEFDPDPDKPCGWTIPKRNEATTST